MKCNSNGPDQRIRWAFWQPLAGACRWFILSLQRTCRRDALIAHGHGDNEPLGCSISIALVSATRHTILEQQE